MKVIHYEEIEPTRFHNSVAKEVEGRVVIGRADGAENFCMRLFELAPGGHTPFHQHPWEHELFFHKGEGEVYCNGDWLPVGPGSVVFIPGEEEHQIRNLSSAPLTFVCLVPPEAPEL